MKIKCLLADPPAPTTHCIRNTHPHRPFPFVVCALISSSTPPPPSPPPPPPPVCCSSRPPWAFLAGATVSPTTATLETLPTTATLETPLLPPSTATLDTPLHSSAPP
ncbi:hypothetical protein K440DRAFT_328448 [Wilcoxina mikolae CBS 423.85]|nr:hypothetical protein K440DRAFT_328448 [Wilcoxina mikolae CBS 423.85]